MGEKLLAEKLCECVMAATVDSTAWSDKNFIDHVRASQPLDLGRDLATILESQLQSWTNARDNANQAAIETIRSTVIDEIKNLFFAYCYLSHSKKQKQSTIADGDELHAQFYVQLHRQLLRGGFPEYKWAED